jgi:hypothetical protein
VRAASRNLSALNTDWCHATCDAGPGQHIFHQKSGRSTRGNTPFVDHPRVFPIGGRGCGGRTGDDHTHLRPGGSKRERWASVPNAGLLDPRERRPSSLHACPLSVGKQVSEEQRCQTHHPAGSASEPEEVHAPGHSRSPLPGHVSVRSDHPSGSRYQWCHSRGAGTRVTPGSHYPWRQ